MSQQIRILIVDDHRAVREGLAEMISAQSDMAVAGIACDGVEAVTMFGQLRPDVTVIDMRLPKLGGLDAIRAIRRANAQSRFIVMTSFQGDQGREQAISAGASAYLLKETFGDELLAAIRAVHAGRECFPSISHT
ncbi:MAG: response regulator transcription factor [Blastocatellia bacterium]